MKQNSNTHEHQYIQGNNRHTCAFLRGSTLFQPQRTTSRERRLVRDAGLVGCHHVSIFTKINRCMWLSEHESTRRVSTAIRGMSTIWSTSCDLHNTTRYCRSWANLKNRFSVASAHRATARLATCQLEVRERTWKIPNVWSMALLYRQNDGFNWPHVILPPPGFDYPREFRFPAAAPVSTF